MSLYEDETHNNDGHESHPQKKKKKEKKNKNKPPN